jgi:hypothetical protein
VEVLLPRTSDIIISNNTIAPTTHNHGDVYHVVVVVVVDEEDELPPPASPPEAGASWATHKRVIKLRNRKQLHAFHTLGISNRFMIYFFKLTIMGPISFSIIEYNHL